jgi:hypothetical protein
MSETKKRQSGNLGLAIILAIWLAATLGAGYLGARNVTRRFERQGYVLIKGIDGEAVATVTPVFEEWRK